MKREQKNFFENGVENKKSSIFAAVPNGVIWNKELEQKRCLKSKNRLESRKSIPNRNPLLMRGFWVRSH